MRATSSTRSIFLDGRGLSPSALTGQQQTDAGLRSNDGFDVNTVFGDTGGHFPPDTRVSGSFRQPLPNFALTPRMIAGFFQEDYDASRKNGAQHSVHCQAGPSLPLLKLPMAIPPLSKAFSSSGMKTGIPLNRSAILVDPHHGQWDGFWRVRIFIVGSMRMSDGSWNEDGMVISMR